MSLLELSHDRISDVIYTTKDKTIVIFQSYSFHEDQLAKKELSDEQRYSANNNSEIEWGLFLYAHFKLKFDQFYE